MNPYLYETVFASKMCLVLSYIPVLSSCSCPFSVVSEKENLHKLAGAHTSKTYKDNQITTDHYICLWNESCCYLSISKQWHYYSAIIMSFFIEKYFFTQKLMLDQLTEVILL